MSKIKITAVSYLNTKPMLYGLLNSPVAKQIDLSLDIPSICAEKLQHGEADLGLIPVAAIPSIPSAKIISKYCIGSDGPVQTVGLYGDVPVHEMEAIYLDFHSRTSVQLLKILLNRHWHHQPRFINTKDGFESNIVHKNGGLVIGDKAIGLENKHPFFYDLSEEWKTMTGLPFVFAAWVSNKELDPNFVNAFNDAIAKGLSNISSLVYLLPSPHPDFDLKHYFNHGISYDLDAAKKEALSTFFKMLEVEEPLFAT